MTAGEVCPATENGDPATAASSWAEKSMPFTAHRAGCGVEADEIPFWLRFPALIPVAIVPDHAPRLWLDIGRACHLTAARPGHAAADPGFQIIVRCVAPNFQ